METDAGVGDGDGRYCWTIAGEPNPETYPCFSGPMFTPFDLASATITPSFGVETALNTAVFSNTTTADVPVNFAWAFGDGVGTATNLHPTYAYPLQNGTYTTTLTADALGWGMETAVGPVDVVVPNKIYLPFVVKLKK